MNQAAIDRSVMGALLGSLLLALAGAALVAASRHEVASANRELAAARAERARAEERLRQITQDEREVAGHARLYRRLVALNIVGAERRLEWSEAITRIREARRLGDLRHQIAPRRPLESLPGRPGRVESFASRMRIEMTLVHEGDLLRFLGDLRAAGYAYPVVHRCSIARRPLASVGSAPAPGLQASCEIDLITVQHEESRT
jgi:hypothetical protein